MTAPDRTTEEAKTDKYPPLDKAARERLGTLIDEAMDMNLALKRLTAADDSDDIPAAMVELHRAMTTRLVKSANLLYGHDEEGN